MWWSGYKANHRITGALPNSLPCPPSLRTSSFCSKYSTRTVTASWKWMRLVVTQRACHNARCQLTLLSSLQLRSMVVRGQQQKNKNARVTMRILRTFEAASKDKAIGIRQIKVRVAGDASAVHRCAAMAPDLNACCHCGRTCFSSILACCVASPNCWVSADLSQTPWRRRTKLGVCCSEIRRCPCLRSHPFVCGSSWTTMPSYVVPQLLLPPHHLVT